MNAEIIQKIRDLPESCAMRDGRKWKRIPIIVLTSRGGREYAYDGLDIEYVVDVTEWMIHSGYASPVTWRQIEDAVNRYHRKALTEYEKSGFLVTGERGLYRVKRALKKKNDCENDYYFAGKDTVTYESTFVFL